MDITGKVLQKVHADVKADHERQIFLSDHLPQKITCHDFFFRQHALHAAAAVNENAQRQWLIGFRREIPDRLRLAVLVDLKIFFRQIGDKSAVLVFHIEEHIDHIHVLAEGGGLVLLAGVLPNQGYRRQECSDHE